MVEEKNEEQRVRLVRTRMLIHYPFWGELCISLGLRPSPLPPGLGGETFSTDGDRLYYPPAPFLDEWDDETIMFSLAHEVLHCGLGHFWRQGSRSKRGWRVAADLAVNSLLRASNFPMGKTAKHFLWPEQFGLPDGLGAEEYYSKLPKDLQTDHVDYSFGMADGSAMGAGGPSEGGDGGGSGGDTDQNNAPKPKPVFGSLDAQAKAELWTARMVRAATVAKMMGHLPAGIQDIIDALLYPKISWRYILADAVPRQGIGYDWCVPNPRYAHLTDIIGDDVVIPSEVPVIPNIVVAMDTSGSISKKELQVFLTEISALAQEAHLTVIACDAAIHAIEEFPAGQVPTLEDLNKLCVGRGGTDFRPVFRWVADEGGSPDMLVYLTDGYGPFPDNAPFYPVWWLTTGAEPKHYPFGRVVEYALEEETV